MKPLLRTLLVVDALLMLVFGLVMIFSPWLSSVVVLSAFASQPALIGQLLGVMLLGMAWLQCRAAGNGILTAAVARSTGLTQSVAAIVLMVWLIAAGMPDVTRTVQYGGIIVGVILLVLGLALARLSVAVDRRDRVKQAEVVSSVNAPGSVPLNEHMNERMSERPNEPVMGSVPVYRAAVPTAPGVVQDVAPTTAEYAGRR